MYNYNYIYNVTEFNADWRSCGRTTDAETQLDYRRMIDRFGDRRTSRHCFIFYLVRAGGSCGNSLPDIYPKAKSKNV